MSSPSTLMGQSEMGYGLGSVNFDFDEDRFCVLSARSEPQQILNDAQIGSAIDSPIASPRLEDIVNSEDSVLIVVSDATRATASAQVVNLLVRRLIQNGVSPTEIAIIFATGIHRPVTPKEKVELLTSFLVQRVRTIDHDPYDLAGLTDLGTTERGTPVIVNSNLRRFSRVIICGGIGFHYFAGFSGGRKSICPGLASARTVEATHMLAIDFAAGGRRTGVGAGMLEGNAVHEECEQIAQMTAPAFSVNAIVDERGRAVSLFCGDWRAAHRTGCDEYIRKHSINVGTKRDLVIVSCGGLPYDINLIQAHKALEMAAHACNDGGTIVLLAECRDGLGRPDFLKWFDGGSSRSLTTRLRRHYEVNGQTAWSLLTKTERFKIYLMSELPDVEVLQMGMTPIHQIATAFDDVASETEGYIMPRGAALFPRVLP